MKNQRTFIHYIDDILLSMERIVEYIDDYDYVRFKEDYKTVDAVIRNFEIIGEAAKNLPEDFKNKYPSIPWDEMYSLRNKVSHEYFGIDHEVIWDIAKNYLPANLLELVKIRKLLQQ